jgi:hypothetical protein
MTYLTIYQIEHSINLNKKKLPWSKWPMGSSQVGHLIKLDKANHMFGQNDKWFSNPIEHPMLFNRPN